MRFAALALLALAAAMRADAAADPARYLKGELISETTNPKPGSTFYIGIRMTPKPGWHGYWSNPGDSGIATTGSWSAPAGVKIGPLLHPAPTLMIADGRASFVHAGPHILLSQVHLPANVRRGTRIPIVAELRWAACTATQCVPLKARLALDLVAGNGAPSRIAPMIRSAASRLPRRAPNGTYVRNGKAVGLTLPTSLRLDWRKILFFPDDSAPFDVANGSATLVRGRVIVKLPLRSAPTANVTGVVSDGRHAYRISFQPVGH